MASPPDMTSLMKQEPSAVEVAQNEMAAERSAWATRVLAGDPRDPSKRGVARELSKRIDQMSSPENLGRERGRMNVGLQQKMGEANTLRSMAMSKAGGSGAASDAMRSQQFGLSAAREQGATGIQVKTKTAQEKARTGFTKMGEGMMDTIVTHYGNLGSLESKAAQTRLEKGITDAERGFKSQVGAMEMGAGLLGMVSSAGARTLDSKGVDAQGNTTYGTGDAKNTDGFAINFGRNLASGASGGAFTFSKGDPWLR